LEEKAAQQNKKVAAKTTEGAPNKKEEGVVDNILASVRDGDIWRQRRIQNALPPHLQGVARQNLPPHLQYLAASSELESQPQSQ
jgi:hypothetical protein